MAVATPAQAGGRRSAQVVGLEHQIRQRLLVFDVGGVLPGVPELALLGPLRQGDAVVLQIFALAVLRVLALLFPAPGTAFLLAAALACRGAAMD